MIGLLTGSRHERPHRETSENRQTSEGVEEVFQLNAGSSRFDAHAMHHTREGYRLMPAWQLVWKSDDVINVRGKVE